MFFMLNYTSEDFDSGYRSGFIRRAQPGGIGDL